MDTVGARTWWRRQRLVYNAGLVAAGMAAFCAAGMIREFSRKPVPETGVTPFTLLFQMLEYLAAMAAANLCYSLGPALERFVREDRVEQYRRWAFGCGFVVSLIAPLAIPVWLALRG